MPIFAQQLVLLMPVIILVIFIIFSLFSNIISIYGKAMLGL